MLNKNEDEIYKKEKIDELVNAISEDIMVDNIIGQIDNSLNENTLSVQSDLFEYFEERFNFVMNTYKDQDDILKRAINNFDSVLDRILNSIKKLFKFDLVFDTGIDLDTKITLVKALYEFFIIYIKDNCESLIYNSITENIDSLISLCDVHNKKDLTYINIKKIINNKYTPVIYCFDIIIKNIYSDSNDTTLYYMVHDDPELFCNFYVTKIFKDCYFSDISFKESLFDILIPKILNDYSLQLTIKNRLINKYKNL